MNPWRKLLWIAIVIMAIYIITHMGTPRIPVSMF